MLSRQLTALPSSTPSDRDFPYASMTYVKLGRCARE